MFLSNISVDRPVTVTMLIMVFIVFGILGYMTLSLNLMPDVDIPYVTIQTIYPGAGPAEIEEQVTKLIEDAISTISDIDFIQSYSMDNVSVVLVAFNFGKNVDVGNQEIKDNVDMIINNLPESIEKPVVRKIDIAAMPVIRMVLSGEQSSLELFEYADKTLKDRFSQINGVASVDVSGGQEREIQVVFNERTVFANNISLQQIAGILAMYNVNLPAGNFKATDQEVSVKIQGEIADIKTLREIEIPTAFGNKRLSEIAEINDTGTELRQRQVFFDMEKKAKYDNVISINLIKGADGNPVEISNRLLKQMKGINESLPQGMELTIIDDNSEFIKSAVSDTLNNIYMGVLFTGLILLFFLHDLRSTLIVALSMPVSIVSTFMLMQMFGFTLNMLSLLGLSTSVGVLVANSIVVLENIFRHKDLGHGRKESAKIGTSEITVAVLASTLTNLVVFLPIGTMGGMMGQIFKEFGLTVVFATSFSLLTAFTLTPMLAAVILPKKPKMNKISKFIEDLLTWIEDGYGKMVSWVLKTRVISGLVVVGAIVLFLFSLFVATKVGFEFMPNLDVGSLGIMVELPIGYNLDQTAQVMSEIEAIITNHPEVTFVLTGLGTKGRTNIGLNMANTLVKLVDAKDRDISTQQMVDKLITELAYIPNAKITVAAQSIGGGGAGDEPIQLLLMGLEDDKLVDISNEVLDAIRDIPGLVNLDTSTRAGKPEITITPKREQLALTGVSVMEMAIGIRASMEGLIATQYKEAGNEYDIKVTMAEEAYNTPEKLRNLTIVTSRGKFQLSQLADVTFTEGVNQITRRDKAKTITLTASPATGIPVGVVMNEITARLQNIDFPEGYSYLWSGDAEQTQEAMFQMGRAAILAFLLTYMLLAAILESFVQPLLILATVPLGLVGVFFIQFLTGLTMNLFSMMAIIMLIGIVVNNAILIMDYANQLIREAGKTVHDALVEACPTKLRPILMSNIAIILGMLPMAMGIGAAGKEFRQSMGVVSIGGLVMSTVLTLFVIPTLYYITTKTKKSR